MTTASRVLTRYNVVARFRAATEQKKPLATFTNKETGMEARIFLNADGKRYNVMLHDVDSGETVGGRIDHDLARATAYAKHVVGNPHVEHWDGAVPH